VTRRITQLCTFLFAFAASFGCHAAELERLSGTGTLIRSFVSSALEQGIPLRNEDEIRVDPASEALVRISEKVAFVIRAGSSMMVTDVSEEAGPAMRLLRGAIRYVSGLTGPTRFRIVSPHVSAGVRGTDFEILVFDTPVPGGRPAGTYITVRHGAVDVTDSVSGGVATVTEAQSVYARAPGQDPAGVVAQASPAEGRRSRALTRPGVQPPGMVSLGRVSDGMWRVEPFTVERGDFDDLLDRLR
jgi:hypothetical protein